MAEQMKHTPGPWRVKAGRYIEPATPAGFIAFVYEKGDAIYEKGYHQGFARPEELAANAALIAAAPELLEALEACVDYLPQGGESYTVMPGSVATKARAAIAKAEKH